MASSNQQQFIKQENEGFLFYFCKFQFCELLGLVNNPQEE
jgi:hypothetical protein